MKKYLILSFLFLLAITPVLAKSTTETGGQQTAVSGSQSNTTSGSQNTVTVSPTRKPVISPTGNQVKNTNVVQTQNQGEDSQLSVKTQEVEQLNQAVEDSLTKVSDQVLELIESVGAKGGIGQQVKVIAQSQQQIQEKIKNSYEQLKNRGQLVRLFVGSDKKMIQSLEQLTEENQQKIEELEQLKTKTLNQADLDQFQLTIENLLYQNTSLGEKIVKEKQVDGLFGWFVKLFNKE